MLGYRGMSWAHLLSLRHLALGIEKDLETLLDTNRYLSCPGCPPLSPAPFLPPCPPPPYLPEGRDLHPVFTIHMPIHTPRAIPQLSEAASSASPRGWRPLRPAISSLASVWARTVTRLAGWGLGRGSSETSLPPCSQHTYSLEGEDLTPGATRVAS